MKTILLIDDDAAIRDSVSLILKNEGYKVILAENGENGVSLALAYKPDLILCDISMPGMSGLETFSEVNYDSIEEMIPFVFVTAKADKIDVRKAMHLGAADYITKPFQIDDLLATVKTQLLKKELLIQRFQGERIRLLAKLEDELLAKNKEIERLQKLLPEQKDELPLHKESILSKDESKAEKSSNHILLIVYSPLLRLRITSNIRKLFSCNIYEAETMQEALRLTDSLDIAYIILESSLPKLDPLKIIRQIKFKPNLASAPILIAAENIDQDMINTFAKIGNIDFILNPFHPEKLVSKISKYITQVEHLPIN
ncbi:MAG: response regulator [Leptospiraceae bacterium]|nr:response regulator [Leptospiraceae bacterium]